MSEFLGDPTEKALSEMQIPALLALAGLTLMLSVRFLLAMMVRKLSKKRSSFVV